MAVFGLMALLLVMAAVAQAVRLGFRRSDWLPLVLLAGFALATVVLWLVARHPVGR